jgi:PAS domain S-box-containing protein
MEIQESLDKLDEKSKRNSERLLALMKATSDVIYIMSPDWKIMKELDGRGFLSDTEEPNPKWLDKYIPPEDQAFIASVINECINEKKTFDLEHTVLKDDGSIGWTHSCAVPIFDEKGEIKEWVGVARDITVQKKAEEEFQCYADELKRKEKETLELIDSFTEGSSWIVDLVAGTIICSEKWAKRIGLDLVPEEEGLAYAHTLIHPDDTTGGNSISYYIEIGATRFDLEYRIKTVDSGYIWVKHRGKIVYNEQGQAAKVYGATFDITERKQMEDALRDSEQRFRLATQAAGMYTWELDVSTGEIRFFGDVKGVIGFSYTAVDDVFSLIERYTAPEDSARHQEALLRTMRGEGDLHSINRVINPDTGEILWMETHATTLVAADDGTQQRVVGIACNITERKRVEEALCASEAKYRTIFETSQEGIWVINGKDQTILVNERLQQMLGYSFDELMGLSPQALMAPEFQAAANERLADHMEGNRQVLDYRFIRKDGSDLWCILSATPLFDKNGKFDGSVAMITDITDRKKIEIENDHYMKIVEERADWNQAIIDLIPAGIWISDHSGKVVMVNQEAKNMYRGSSPLSGSPEEYTSYKLFLPGTDEPVVFEPYVPKEALHGVVLDFERFDGTRGTLVVSTEALRDKEGNIINYVAISMDITSLREAEKALKKSENNALELVDKLNQAQEELINALHLAEQKSAEWNAIVDAVPDGLTVYGKSGEIIYE